MLVLHGLAGAKHHWLPYMFVLATRGFSVYSIDLCMHGDWDDASRRRELMETNFAESIRRVVYDSAKMIRKLLDGWSNVTTPIGLVGISAGGFVAHVLATEKLRFNSIVAVISSPDWTTADPTRVPEPGTPLYAMLRAASPVNHAHRYAPTPLLMLNGDADMTVRHVGSIALYEKLTEIYAKRGIADRVCLRIHEGIPHAFTDPMQEESIQWLKRFSDK